MADSIAERALEYWPQYTVETLPTRIWTAVRDRMERENGEEQDEMDGTAEQRRIALAAAREEEARGDERREASHAAMMRGAARWEELPPANIGRRIYRAALMDDLRACGEETKSPSMRGLSQLHWEHFGH